MTKTALAKHLDVHVFELSGLGKAPFTIIIPKHDEPGVGEEFWCAHCGTQLKNRHFVKSRCGKISVVGIDCLNKSGDGGLIDGVKILLKQARLAATKAEAETKRLAILDAQRARNGGATNWEAADEYKTELEKLMQTNVVWVNANPVIGMLTEHGFQISMHHRALLAEPYTPSMLACIASVCASKTSRSRKTTAAYKEAYKTAMIQVELLQAHIQGVAASRQSLIDTIERLTSSPA